MKLDESPSFPSPLRREPASSLRGDHGSSSNDDVRDALAEVKSTCSLLAESHPSRMSDVSVGDRVRSLWNLEDHATERQGSWRRNVGEETRLKRPNMPDFGIELHCESPTIEEGEERANCMKKTDISHVVLFGDEANLLLTLESAKATEARRNHFILTGQTWMLIQERAPHILPSVRTKKIGEIFLLFHVMCGKNLLRNFQKL
ncbi:unnamed protein product [Protopolystoma xenopodis]|uniref:Uncharacterized protein n=1 Tax=Protopolystoma xenopodis TaxID=117903 RepID=A0A3S5B5M4_9PLAT|nr:unnamed protein product [Protopolystoma xenopodis]